MFARIVSYQRYKDLYSWKCLEVKFSLVFTIVFYIFFLNILDLYEKMSLYIQNLKDSILCIIAGDFGLLGVNLAGMAIITSLFTPEIMEIIKRVDKKDTINRLLSSFEFSAFNVILQIIYMLLLYFSFSSDKPLLGKLIFSIIFVAVVYHTFFNLFYILALIGNCITINNIKNKCVTVKNWDKTIIDAANEIRVEYLLAIILKEKNIDRLEFINKLDNMIDISGMERKEEIKEYLHHYYGV